MQKIYGVIYKITNKINNKCYIGQTIRDFNKRYEATGEGIERVYNFHKNNKKYGIYYNKHLLSSIEKYGLDNFDVNKKLDVAYSKEELDMKEIYYISLYDSYNNGYNNTRGGDGVGSNDIRSKKIICLNNNEIFNTISDVRNKYQINPFYNIIKPNEYRNYLGCDENGKDLLFLEYNSYLNKTKGEIKYGIDEDLEVLTDYILTVNKRKQENNIKYYNEKDLKNKMICKNTIYLEDLENIEELEENIIDKNIIPQNTYLNKYNINNNKLIKIYNDFLQMYNDDNFRHDKNIKKSSCLFKNGIKTLKEDILYLKERDLNYKERNNFKFNKNETKYDEIDFFLKEHIKCLLQIKYLYPKRPNNTQDNLYNILLDLEDLINKTNFTKTQKKVLELYKNGFIISEISKQLNKSNSAISNTLDIIVNKIIKTYEKQYEDWYYLNICKGKYKKCNKCSEIKLINKFSKNGEKGYKSICKDCENKRKNNKLIIKNK